MDGTCANNGLRVPGISTELPLIMDFRTYTYQPNFMLFICHIEPLIMSLLVKDRMCFCSPIINMDMNPLKIVILNHHHDLYYKIGYFLLFRLWFRFWTLQIHTNENEWPYICYISMSLCTILYLTTQRILCQNKWNHNEMKAKQVWILLSIEVVYFCKLASVFSCVLAGSIAISIFKYEIKIIFEMACVVAVHGKISFTCRRYTKRGEIGMKKIIYHPCLTENARFRKWPDFFFFFFFFFMLSKFLPHNQHVEII